MASASNTYVSTLDKDGRAVIPLKVVGEMEEGGGMPFRTDSGQYQLDNIVINLRMVGHEYNFSIGLYRALQWSPMGEELVSFSMPSSFTYDFEDVVLTPDAPFTLEANTSYVLLIVPRSSDAAFDWHVAQTTDGYTTLPGHPWTMLGTVLMTLDGGETWFESSGNTFRAMGAVNATAIPEPTTAAFLAVAFIGYGVCRRVYSIRLIA